MKSTPLVGILCTAHCGQQHGIAHAYFYCSISLFGEFSGLYGDDTAVAKLYGFLYWL